MVHSAGLIALASQGLSYLDVQPGTPRTALDELCVIHLSLFSEGYAHGVADFEQTWRRGSQAHDIVEHQWLLYFEGKPCGEFVFQSNFRRGIISRLFLGLLPDFRNKVDREWISDLLAKCEATAAAESDQGGRAIMAMMSEIKPRHARGWRSLGHVTPEIGYQEPLHGNHWREFGQLEYQPMTANFLILEAGACVSMAEIATAGVQAFLVDYYAVPSDDQVLQRILHACSGLREVSD